MDKIQTFKDLHVWQKGHESVLIIYKMTKSFPSDELFGLVSQMRRSAVSITSNIAEGFGRSSQKEKVHFYSIARGSITELQNQLLIYRDVGYMTHEQFVLVDDDLVVVLKMLSGLIKSAVAKVDLDT